jgi:transcriptional regulator with XRE-family HTH domain
MMDKLTDAQIGVAVRVARQAARLTGRSLAEKIEISPTTLSKIESGKQSLSFGSAVALSNVLGINVSHLARLAEDAGVIAENASTVREKLKNDLQALEHSLIAASVSRGLVA